MVEAKGSVPASELLGGANALGGTKSKASGGDLVLGSVGQRVMARKGVNVEENDKVKARKDGAGHMNQGKGNPRQGDISALGDASRARTGGKEWSSGGGGYGHRLGARRVDPSMGETNLGTKTLLRDVVGSDEPSCGRDQGIAF
ncbi:unnamed protein product [Ilex paraguariensis]|uniref:Uncharacterized protein n=1 Tax=Ilex paraguariensis TaxID=185542 RepID=A0ABC8RTL0_9AQUA